MDRVHTWFGMTASHGFNIDVYQDAGEFVAIINTFSASTHRHSGTLPEAVEFDISEEARADGLERLQERVKERIARRCGAIKQFDSRH